MDYNHVQSIEHCVIALFSNYTYYTETKIIDVKLKLCSKRKPRPCCLQAFSPRTVKVGKLLLHFKHAACFSALSVRSESNTFFGSP